MNKCYKTTTFLPSEGAISNCFQPFPLGHLWTFKKNALRKNVFFEKLRVGQVLAWSCFRPFPTVSDRFRPFPTVSIFLSDELDQFRLWKADPVQTRANHDAQVFSCNLCARTLPQMLHRDLDMQYFLKIPKSQELVKFDILLLCILYIFIHIGLCMDAAHRAAFRFNNSINNPLISHFTTWRFSSHISETKWNIPP